MNDIDLTQYHLLGQLFIGCLLDPLKHYVLSKLYLSGENPDDFVRRHNFVRGQRFDFEISESRDERLFLKIMAYADCGFREEERSIAKSLQELANRYHHEPYFSFYHIREVTDLAKRLFSIIPAFIPRDTRLLYETCGDLMSL